LLLPYSLLSKICPPEEICNGTDTEKKSVNKQAARISFSRPKSEGIPTRQTDSLERMPMMHEEQKSDMSWNAQKNAREGKKKRLVVVLGEAGEQKGALLRGCGNLVVVAFGILARRDQPVANSQDGIPKLLHSSWALHHAMQKISRGCGMGHLRRRGLFSSRCFQFTPLHSLLRVRYLLCVFLNTDMDQPSSSLSLMCRCSLSSSLDQPQRTTALATSRNKMRERFPFHCSNSVDK
jgi:hypothetical protein